MGPLEGMLVVAVEQAVAAPLCTLRLADAGARVIKIERAEGDFARGYDTAAKGDSSYFVWVNQGKESVVLDFKAEVGAEQLHQIIAKADVFVQNLAPGAMARAGFGSEDLRAQHPRLVTCDISGYGDSAELRDMKAYDFLVQAETGLVSISGGPNEMGRVGVSVCDIGAGMTAHAAIVEALLLRTKNGQGSGVQVSLFDVTAEWMAVPLMHHEHGSGGPTRQGLKHPSIAPYGAFTTSEGAQTIVSIQNEREWARFCKGVLLHPDMQNDPRFSGNTARVQNRAVLEIGIHSVIAKLDKETFRERLQNASIAFGALNSLQDLSNHAGLRRRQVTTPKGEELGIPAPPIRWVGKEKPNEGKAPTIGFHTDSVLAEFKK